MPEVLVPPPGAVGLSAVRALGDGSVRQYTGVEFVHAAGVRRFLHRLSKLGYLQRAGADQIYAVLDVLDRSGDIIADFAIPTRRAFVYIYRKLKLRVDHTNDDL